MRWFSSDKLIRLYQYGWVATVAATLALRFTVFTETGDRSLLAIAYILGTWLPLMSLNGVWARNLTSYLKTSRGKKWAAWAKLTYFPSSGFGIGGMTPKPVSWLQSSPDEDSPRQADMKQRHRDFIRFALTVFVTYPVMLVVLVY
jgi:hypothetical protein